MPCDMELGLKCVWTVHIGYIAWACQLFGFHHSCLRDYVVVCDNCQWWLALFLLLFLFFVWFCLLHTMRWLLCFLWHLVLALRGTFFIVVLKWALFDWSCVRYSGDVGRQFYMKKHLAFERS
jgi:hypothetical protein